MHALARKILVVTSGWPSVTALASGSGTRKQRSVAAVVPAASTTTAPTTTTTTVKKAIPIVDPCLVGTWHTISDASFYSDTDNGITYHTAGGAGIVVTIQASG